MMRPLHLCALLVGVAVAGTACGGDNGGTGPGTNHAPTAAFSIACTDLACTFTDASSDQDGDALTYAWAFGETGSASNTSTAQSPTHTYAAAGAYHVTLTVTDAKGAASAVADSTVTVSGGPPSGPTADFTYSCTALDCSFTDASTPAGSLTYDWDFGDGSAHSSDQNPTHSYTASDVSGFNVTLIVTDPQGLADTATQAIRVTPPGLECTSSATTATCTFTLTQKDTLTATVISHDCQLSGDRLRVIAPVIQTIFLNGCNAALNQALKIVGPNPDGSFDAGAQIQTEFTQGTPDPDDPPTGPPSIQVTGTFPDWTLKIDDGGNAQGTGEPDFDDIIVTLHASTVP